MLPDTSNNILKVIDALSYNTTVTELEIYPFMFNINWLDALVLALQKNYTLTKLNTSFIDPKKYYDVLNIIERNKKMIKIV